MLLKCSSETFFADGAQRTCCDAKLNPGTGLRVIHALGLQVCIPGLSTLVVSVADSVALVVTLLRDLASSRHDVITSLQVNGDH